MARKPKKDDYHAGCLLHDNLCLDEQMKAGCTVDMFICHNCRDLFVHGELDGVLAISTAINNVFGFT